MDCCCTRQDSGVGLPPKFHEDRDILEGCASDLKVDRRDVWPDLLPAVAFAVAAQGEDAVALGMFQRMPDSLRRWPIRLLQPASTTPEPTNMPSSRKTW